MWLFLSPVLWLAALMLPTITFPRPAKNIVTSLDVTVDSFKGIRTVIEHSVNAGAASTALPIPRVIHNNFV
ncbi:hypothetical protein I7I53_03181 [Histoplasma capsulatum var. duboisii H88]|uniref:Uncharacterized protein n=1 Tax=Ajellomyces capsulatus (strain H88) TaxID=544711 RepID=A0A8A1LMZ3_AJEC8|nr:hypothetical protein I7I53_03181 [Histoplasma capsulatum var. duboisii H88]